MYRNPVLPRNRIDAVQNAGLEQIVEHAVATVPYFERMFAKLGGVPRNRQGAIDLARIPITRRVDLSSTSRDDLLSRAFAIEKLNERRTGGTTGRPIDIFWDDALADRRAASLYRFYFLNGYRVTDSVANLMYLPTPPNPLRRLGLLRRHSIPYGIPIEEQMDLLEGLRPDVLEGYASRLDEIASEVLRRGSTSIRPKRVFSNSEKLQPAVRSKLRSAFGVEPTDVYESWEFGTVAWECPRHSGFHVNEDVLILEIVKEDGTQAEPGEEGEIVVTDLHNRAMPFIRYATGDLAVRADAPCGCGITFSVLQEIVGRTSEKVYTSDGRSFAATTHLCGIISQYEGVVQYQFTQNEIGALELRVACNDEFMAQGVEKCRKEIVEFFGLDSVAVERVERIEKTGVGKFRTFVSNVKE